MQKKRNLSAGAVLASSVAALLFAGCNKDDSDDDATGGQQSQLTCLGGNECAGMSECAGGPGMSSCEGMNECKGMGWVFVESEADCEEKGGTIQTEET